MNKRGRTRNAVDIVIAEQCNPFFTIYSANESLSSFAQTTNRKRVGNVRELRAQMSLRFYLIGTETA
jgi:hypothetical protein